MGKKDKKTDLFYEIVTLKYDEAEPLIDRIEREGDYEGVLEYLKQWDYGPEMEHSPSYEKPWWHPQDRVYNREPAYDGWTYTIWKSWECETITLTRWRTLL